MRAPPPDGGLGKPVKPFSQTFSAATVIKRAFFPHLLTDAERASIKGWQLAETAPLGRAVLVCNPPLGGVPVVAKRYATRWINAGAIPVGRSSANYTLDPPPLYWRPLPDLPEFS